ncbi:MAG TPA: hypothetical protein VGQ44_19495 [Gemmatimonadaceae bacterium]|jgi:hypothetical protein|nr:hypothetical protein [Gemmatimonadaceae bacterium]
MNNETAYIAIMSVIGVVAFGTTLKFVLRLIELRHERLTRNPPGALVDLTARLDRIENAVETTALEVERISEANRFMAKLLAERNAAPGAVPSPAKSERVITPH